MSDTTVIDHKPEGFVSAYSDPTADVILISDDGTKFRVHSYYLKAFSSVFRDMIFAGSLTQTEMYGQNEVQLDIATEVLAGMLDFVHRLQDAARPSLETLESVWDFAVRFDFDMHPPLIREKIMTRASEDAWTAFCIGARKEDMELMTIAIRALKNDYYFNDIDNCLMWHRYAEQLNQEQLLQCPPVFALRFVMSIARYEAKLDFSVDDHVTRPYDFDKVALIFERGVGKWQSSQ